MLYRHFFDKSTKNFYLLDEERSFLQVINQDKPFDIYSLDFSKMEIAKTGKKSNENIFEVHTEISDFTFFVNSVTKKIRYKKVAN